MQIGGESVGSVWVCNVPPHRAQLFPWVVPAVALLPYAGKSFDPLGGELRFICPADGDRWCCPARFNVVAHFGFAV